jgi:hypothetical protein
MKRRAPGEGDACLSLARRASRDTWWIAYTIARIYCSGCPLNLVPLDAKRDIFCFDAFAPERVRS